MKSGLIIVNAYADLKPVSYQTARLQEEFAKLGVQITVKRCGEFLAPVGVSPLSEILKYDFCVYLDKDKYLSQILERTGLRLFNPHAAIRACDDKMQTHIILSAHSVPMPETVAAPLCYTPSAKPDKPFLDKIEKTLGYPVIVKGCYGSRGEAVFKADDRVALNALSEKMKCTPHLYQSCVKESLGKDVRVILVGGKVVAAMKRSSENDFRSNIELGGTGKKFDVPQGMQELCEKVSAVLNLDYCGVDVLLGKDGYLVCEVNSNAFFGGIESVTGVNVAKAYAEYINGVIYAI